MITPIFVRIHALNDGTICVRPDQITLVEFPSCGPNAGLIVIHIAGNSYTIPQDEWALLFPFMKFLHTKQDVDRYLGLDPDIPF